MGRQLGGILLVSMALFALVSGCGDKITVDPSSDKSQFNFGEAVFQVTRNYLLATASNPVLTVQTFDSRRRPFVDSINHMVPEEVQENVVAPLKVIYPLVDDGTLPQVTKDLQSVLLLLLSHPQDPQGKTLEAIATLLNSRGISLRDWIVLFQEVVQQKAVEQWIQAFAQFVRENDGVDDFGIPNGEPKALEQVLDFLARKLRSLKQQNFRHNWKKLLLKPVQVRSSLGQPAFAVELDPRGLPLVAKDPVTGDLVAPFVDKDGDGLADTDPYGRFVDVGGREIDITPFGTDGTRDSFGRAISPSGKLLFEYFDSKKTFLGVLLNMVFVAFQKRLPKQAVKLLKGCMDPPRLVDPGTPQDPTDDYYVYPLGPLADLGYGVLEVAKEPSLAKSLEAFQYALSSNPRRTEALLISLGRVLEILQNTNLQISQQELFRLIEDFAPLLEGILKKPNQSSVSTARLLIQTLVQLGQISRNLPRQLAMLMKYKNLQTKALVDFSQPAGKNNRSSLQQVLALLDAMDQCQVPFTGRSLTYIVLDLMAGMTPQSVRNLVLKLDSFLGAIAPLLDTLCPGFQDNRRSLNDLALSGALDAFIPITKVFQQRGELDLLIRVLRRIYQRYPTLIRRAEPTLIRILESGAVENGIDVLKELAKTKLSATGENGADLLADFFFALFDSQRGVKDRLGRRQTRLFDLLYKPLKELATRIQAKGLSSEASSLLSGVFGFITERQINDNGTQNDPSDDFEELKYPNLLPLLLELFRELQRDLGNSVQLSQYQQDWLSFVGGRDFYALLELGEIFHKSQSQDQLYQAVERLLDPKGSGGRDPFGALVKLMVMALQSPVDEQAVRQVAWFLGEVLEPRKGYVQHGLRFFHSLIKQDTGKMFFYVLHQSVTPRKPWEAPLWELYQTARITYRATKGNPSQPILWGRQDVENLVQGVYQFLSDPQRGVDKLFEMIRRRKRR